MEELTIRPGEAGDIAPFDALLARSYPRLLAADYPPSVLVTALPLISRAQPALVTCGTFFVAYRGASLVGGGGWTRQAPGSRGGVQDAIGHIRHFATDASSVRSGVGTALMRRVLNSALTRGVFEMECLSTRTAVPFYERAGFVALDEVKVPLRPGISFPSVRMIRKAAR